MSGGIISRAEYLGTRPGDFQGFHAGWRGVGARWSKPRPVGRWRVLLVPGDMSQRFGFFRRECASAQIGLCASGIDHPGAYRTIAMSKNSVTEDPVEQLRIMIRSHVTYFAANMAALKVCSHELDVLTGSGYEETSRIRREYYQLTRSIVDRMFQKLHPDSTMDRYVATMALFGMLNWLYRWYKPGEDRSPAGLANMIMELYLNGITGPASEKPPASP